MSYRVGEIARAAGVSVDTVRFYQAKGLLPPPAREGRTARYGQEHLQTLLRIRELASEGLTLAVIKRLLDSGEDSVDHKLRDAIDATTGARYLTRMELASETGIPEALLVSAESAGLIQPVVISGSACFTDTDAALIRAGLEVLGHGFPLDDLVALASDYAAAVDPVVERAADLFNEHVRKSDRVASADDVVRAFQSLLPAVASLVALHFQNRLIALGRGRLAADGGAGDELQAAIDAAPPPRLAVVWR